MTLEEKRNLLKKGDRVKLKPLNQLERDITPTIVSEMESLFNDYIKINSVPATKINGEYIFTCEGGFAWNVKWLSESNFVNLPEHLFVIEE